MQITVIARTTNARQCEQRNHSQQTLNCTGNGARKCVLTTTQAKRTAVPVDLQAKPNGFFEKNTLQWERVLSRDSFWIEYSRLPDVPEFF